MDMTKQLTGFITIFRYTTKKILFSKRILIVIFIMAFMCSVSYYGVTQDAKKVDFVNIMDILVLFFIMPIITMIYGCSVIKDEIDDRSITQIVTSPMNKVVTYFGYYIGLVVSTSIIMILVFSSGFLVFFGGTSFDGSSSIFYDLAVLMIIGSIVYSSLFFMVSMFFETPIYFGLFYAFIWEGFIGSLPGSIGKVALKHYIRSIGSEMMSIGDISSYDATSYSDSVTVLVAFVVITSVLGAILFWNKEYP